MATAEDIIKAALSKIGVRNSEVPLTDNQINDAISELNDMMTKWDADGIALGYTIVSKKTDPITTPDWSHGAMKSSLGARSLSEYGKDLTADFAAVVSENFKSIKDRTIDVPDVYFPDTLPIGSGNNIDNFSIRSNFYEDESFDDILSGNGESLRDDEGDQLEQDRSIESNG